MKNKSKPNTQTIFPQLIQTNIPLADKNWFYTGGSAKYYAEPHTSSEFQQALCFAKEHNLDLFLLGNGANILISDDGFDGLVIHPQLNEIKIIQTEQKGEVLIRAGAGVTIPELITFCLNNNIIGLEEFSGIPGTVGGAVFINLHYFEFLLGNFVTEAEVIDKQTCDLQTVQKEWFKFGYNTSTLHEKKHYLVSATFKLKKVNDIQAAYAKGRNAEIIRHRAKRYPQKNTCGSFFRNFHDDEVTLENNGKKIIFVAYYLDKIGVKGNLQVGSARVSYQHANMIVNLGNATSNDIIELARTMQQLVKDTFGITPQPECRLIGFKEYPLLL